jgi:Kef-type K+ transport system membrane component KefB
VDVLLLFLIIMAVAFLSPLLSSGVGLPEVTGIIIFGMVLGWNGLGVVEKSELLFSLSEFGIVFLMFLAGLEMRPSVIEKNWKSASILGAFTFVIPFASGYVLAGFFGYPILIKALIGVILSTTSVGVVTPILKELNILGTRVGTTVLGAAVLDDIASMVALAIIIKAMAGTPFDPISYVITLIIFFMAILYVIPKLADYSLKSPKFMVSIEAETRFLILVLLVVAMVSEKIDLHPIVGAFFAGIAVSEAIKTGWFLEKLNAIGYGFFIPIFFFVSGCSTDVGAILNIRGDLFFATALIIVAIVSKGGGAFFPAIAMRFSVFESIGIGSAMTTRLAVGLAAANIAYDMGKIGESIFSAFVLLAVFTTIITPPLIRHFLQLDAHVEGVVFGS